MQIKANKMSFAEIAFLIGVFAKQFYIFPSGNPQIADFLFLISIVAFVVQNRKEIKLNKEDKLFLVFLTFALIEGCSYYFFTKRLAGVKTFIYLAFNFCLVTCFAQFNKEQSFLKNLRTVLVAALVSQFLCYVFGIGTSWEPVEPRWLSTFNDPNQFGFYVLTAFFLINLCTTEKTKKDMAIVFGSMLVSLFLILKSASFGMLIGFSVFAVTRLYTLLHERNKTLSYVYLLLIAVGVTILLLIFAKEIRIPEFLLKVGAISRIQDRIDDLASLKSILPSLSEDRGWFIVGLYPKCLLFGKYLFGIITPEWTTEIHNTFLDLWFLFGCVPFAILFKWIILKMKSSDSKKTVIFVALFVESLFVVNYRQPFFWMIVSFIIPNSEDKMQEKRIDLRW